MSGPDTKPAQSDPETRRAMLDVIFTVALAAQDEANGVEMDVAGWMARDEDVQRLVRQTEEALQKVLRARALAATVNLATASPAGRA